MKKIIWMFLAIALPMMFTACNDDDENGSKTPEFKGTVFNAAIGEGYSSRNYSTCTVENPHIINSIYFRSIIKENDFNGKD